MDTSTLQVSVYYYYFTTKALSHMKLLQLIISCYLQTLENSNCWHVST